MDLVSAAFDAGELIPARYTCDGANVSPPLTLNNVPDEAGSLAIIMDDLDTTDIVFYHWVVWNIDPRTDEIEEDISPEGAMVGTNSKDENAYFGPCPVSGQHRYRIRLIAISHGLDLPEDTSGEEFEEYIEGLVIDASELIGLYER